MQSHHKPCTATGRTLRRVLLLTFLLTTFVMGNGCEVLEGFGRWVGRGVRGRAVGQNPANPFSDIKTVAVLPFTLGQTQIPIPPDRTLRYAEAFASELAQFKGFTVVRAYELAYLEELQRNNINVMRVSSADDVAEIGRTIQADAVIICKVTDYDPYKPPRLGIELQIFKTADYESVNSKYTDLTTLAGAAGPVVVHDPNSDGPFIIRFEEIYDARHDSTQNALELYAYSRAGEKSPHYLEQYQLESYYIQFVSNQLIRKIISLSTETTAGK